MPGEYTIRIVVSDRGVAGESIAVEGVSALLGSASHCDVRLGPDRAAPEQLLLEVNNGQLFAAARATRPTVLLNQLPFHQGRLLADAKLTIGELEVQASLEQNLLADGRQREARVRPAFVLVTLVWLAVLGLVAWKLTRRERITEAPAAPALFDTRAPLACPEQAPETARLVASEIAAQADARRERAPFLPAEGLAAVPLYRTAASCAERAGDASGATALLGRAKGLQSDLERDYRLHQVRVYLARRAADSELLAREARVLAGYLHDRGGAYSAWLDQVQREIEVQPKKKQPKKKRG